MAIPSEPAARAARPDRGIGAELVAQARRAAEEHQSEHGRAITRDQLRAALGVGTDTASALHRRLRETRDNRTPDTAEVEGRRRGPVVRVGLVPVPPDAFARANGASPARGGEGAR
jgi:hypothetical protein